MKIGIDISSIVYGTGVSVYTKELVRNLVNLDNKNNYLLFGSSFRRREELKNFVLPLLCPNVQGKIFPLAPTLANIVWNKMHALPIEQITGRLDIFHSSDWTQPPTAAYRVTTIHDLVPILHPEWSHPKIIFTHKKRLEHVKKEIDAIIVPSAQTKEDLVELGYDKRKIYVIFEAATPFIKKSNKFDIERVKKKYGLDKYLFSIGVTPRKNTHKIVEAYKKVRKDIDVSLALAGRPVGLDISESDGVNMLGHVPDEDLSALYSGAEALVYPSLYEGFGIPILDAFICETPVVTSNMGSMKEVSGTAAVLVDPESIDSIADGIIKALKNKKSLVARGNKRAKQFSWQKMAKETLEIYKQSTKA